MAHMPAATGESLSSPEESEVSGDEDGDGASAVDGASAGPNKNAPLVVRGPTCICAWCNGRRAKDCPVIRIPVQPLINTSNWKADLRTLLKYLRRNEQYIEKLIASYEEASKQRRRLNYVVHTCHFLRVEPGVGKQSAKLIPFVSVQDIKDNDPVFNPSNLLFYNMLRTDVANQMLGLSPADTAGWKAYAENVERRK